MLSSMKAENRQLAGLGAAERILHVASDLFYNQGYRATGINEVIKKSGVAKATFYSHFPTKEDLAKAYLKLRSEEEAAYLESVIARAKTPRERFLAVMESVGPWLEVNDFRGCVFLNMSSEVPDKTSPLRKAGKQIYAMVRSRVEALGQELIDSNQAKYGQLNLATLANEYMLIFTGAIALAAIYHEIWPFEHGLAAVRRLIGE
jgi:AcrR family transcriptional regulator